MARTKQTARKVYEGPPKSKGPSPPPPPPETTRESSSDEDYVVEENSQDESFSEGATSPIKDEAPSPIKDEVPKNMPTKASAKRPKGMNVRKGKQFGKGKQTGKGKDFKGLKADKPSKPVGVKRKFKQQVRCLREIRKAVKALNLAIPKLPFQRVCRKIAEKFKISMRWTRPALACIQEAAEDFLVEFFQDSYICSAHSHRVTLMDKDMIVLRRLRYRFSKVLEPVPFRDEKTFNILNIPPARKPKEDDIVIEEVLSEEEKVEGEMSPNLTGKDYMMAELLLWEEGIPTLLKDFPKGFLVSAFLPDDIGEREDYIQLDGESLDIIGDKKALVNDPVLLASMR